MRSKVAFSLIAGSVLFVPAFVWASQPTASSESSNKPSSAQSEPVKQPGTPFASDSQQPKDATSAEAKPANEVQLAEVEKQILEKTNAQRVKYGLPPLVADKSLVQTARSHAAWMTNNRTLQHTSRPVGENIAMGQRTTDEAVTDWMNSSGHRANILSHSYKRTGVAAYQTSDGTIYWCQQFLP